MSSTPLISCSSGAATVSASAATYIDDSATVSTADAWLAANPAIVENATPEWEAWNRSFTALRDLVARIDAASASAFGGDDA